MSTDIIILILFIFAILLLKIFFKFKYYVICDKDDNGECDVILFYTVINRFNKREYQNYITIY